MKICVLFTLGFSFIGNYWQLSNIIYDNPLCSGTAHKDERKVVTLLYKAGCGSQHCLNYFIYMYLSWVYGPILSLILKKTFGSLVLHQQREIQFLNFTVIYNGKTLPWDPVHSWRIHRRNTEVFLFENTNSDSILWSPDLKSSDLKGIANLQAPVRLRNLVNRTAAKEGFLMVLINPTQGRKFSADPTCQLG